MGALFSVLLVNRFCKTRYHITVTLLQVGFHEMYTELA